MDFLLHTLCLTYNQESYVEDTLKGFAMQKTEFPVISIIIDDASTDHTAEVLNRFLNEQFSLDDEDAINKETDYGHVTFARHKSNANCFFVVICLKENHYSKSKRKIKYYKEWTNTKYAAICEGDDYWTDPLKLQKQVDFLEAHEDYSMCFTNCIVDRAGKRDYANVTIWDTYTTEDMLLHNSLDMIKRGDHVVSPGHTSTIVYRIPSQGLPKWISKCFIGDEPLFIGLSEFGKAKFINEATSVYRDGIGTSSKGFSQERDYRNRVKMYEVIDEGFDKKYHRLISSKIISRYYKKLTRIAFGEKQYFKSIGYFSRFLWTKMF